MIEHRSESPHRPLPPDSRDEILGKVEGYRGRIYREVRAIVDDLEQAAPWEELFVPSSEATPFLARESEFLLATRSVPGRLEEAMNEMSGATGEEVEATLEEARFYFHRIDEMVANEVEELDDLVHGLAARRAEVALTQVELDRVAEVTLDLKGKYTSALMGAAASLVAEGRWNGVATASILFPEKAKEHERSSHLLATVREAISALRELPYEVDFLAFFERWSVGRRVDKHALTELVALEWRIGKLLQADVRRSLYSGDFHAIQMRSEALARAILELERLHRRTWGTSESTDGAPRPEEPETFPRLVALLLEIATIIDRNLLEMLLGRGKVKALKRAAAEQNEKHTEPSDLARVPADLRHLIRWFHQQDLRLFLEVLRVAVLRRASLQTADPPGPEVTPPEPQTPSREAKQERATVEIEVPPPDAVPPSTSSQIEPDPFSSLEGLRASAPEGTVSPSSRDPAVTQSHERGGSLKAMSVSEKHQALSELDAKLEDLRSPSNKDWHTVTMFRRLLAKHRQVPAALLEGIQPFIFEVLNDLVPLIEGAASFRAVPEKSGTTLVELCVQLSRTDLSAEDMARVVPVTLDRFTRLLDGLSAVTREQLGPEDG